MANSKEDAKTFHCPEFIQHLRPSAERAALLYHLSYLCLGKSPTLFRLIREQAFETLMLFGLSEAFLVKCAGTSDDLVKSLFPTLKKAAEMDKPIMVVKYLEKAKQWIEEINSDMDEMVKRYERHWQSVASSTSDVILERNKTENQGGIPSPTYLREVQQCLSRIQQILLDLRMFWDKVECMLNGLKAKTFAGENLIEDLGDFKEEFLESIESAGECWKNFGRGCLRSQDIFRVQSQGAYRFLEIDPPPLSTEDWDEEFQLLQNRLDQISL